MAMEAIESKGVLELCSRWMEINKTNLLLLTKSSTSVKEVMMKALVDFVIVTLSYLVVQGFWKRQDIAE